MVTMMTSGVEGFPETLKLFRECSLEQVRDYDLELSSKIDKTRNKFREELKTHYKDILEVTGEVDHLYQALKGGDVLFRDLCFKDDLFKLTKLPEFESKSGFQGSRSVGAASPSSDDQCQSVLVVSQWVLAVSDLISRFATSYSSSKLFDSAMQGFDSLTAASTSLGEFREIVQNKCKAFLQFVCSPDVSFSVSQRIQVYNLVVRDHSDQLLWDTELVKKLEEQTFNFILQDHLDDTLRSKDKLVASFVATETFKEKLRSKLSVDISTKIQSLDGLLESNEEPLINADLPALSAAHIQELIQDSQYYCMGLVTDRKVQWYQTVVLLKDLLQKLEQYGGESLGQELRKQLVEKLQKRDSVTDSGDKPSETLSMSELVSKVVDDFNDESFNKTVEFTIQSLTA